VRIEDVLSLGPVMPVVTIDDAAAAVPLARALAAGGVRAVEITLRTPAALEAIRAVAGESDVVVGAGTVLRPADFRAAALAGARFAVSPGATPALLDAGAESGLPYLPAIATPGELMAGLERGFSAFKFFPAESIGGRAALRALAGPFPEARFCATGGIDAANAPDYLALANVPCVGGSWVAPREALRSGDFVRIEALARAAAALR